MIPIGEKKLFLLDIDGTICVGNRLIPGADRFLNGLSEYGGDYVFITKNRLKEVRKEKKLSQTELAEMVGVSRNTISSIETGQFNPTAKLALVLCIALDKKFEELFYFD